MHISTMLVFWSLAFLIRNSVVLAVYLLLLVHFPQLFRLGLGGERLLPLNGHGDILLMLRPDTGNLHGRGEREFAAGHELFQLRPRSFR